MGVPLTKTLMRKNLRAWYELISSIQGTKTDVIQRTSTNNHLHYSG